MATTYRLVGYDRMTDDMVASHPIPFRMVDYVRDRAGVWGRTDIVGEWPLDEIQARSIAWLIDVDIDQQLTLAWFLEPYESSGAA